MVAYSKMQYLLILYVPVPVAVQIRVFELVFIENRFEQLFSL